MSCPGLVVRWSYSQLHCKELRSKRRKEEARPVKRGSCHSGQSLEMLSDSDECYREEENPSQRGEWWAVEKGEIEHTAWKWPQTWGNTVFCPKSQQRKKTGENEIERRQLEQVYRRQAQCFEVLDEESCWGRDMDKGEVRQVGVRQVDRNQRAVCASP